MPRASARLMQVVTLLAMLMPAGLAAAQEHTLAVERDRPVGSKYQVVVKASQTQTQKQTVNGQLVGNNTEKLTGSMTAVSEVLAVHDNKQVKQMKLVVSKFEGKAGEDEVKLDTTKPIIVTADGGETTFEYEDGTALPDKADQLLDILSGFMTDDSPGDATQNQVFKLDKPRAKGSSWECDNELLAKQLSGGGELTIDPKDIDSEFKFLDIAEFAGNESAVFDVAVKLNRFSVAGLNEVPGLKMTKSEGTLKMSGLLPLDTKSGDGALQMQMDMAFDAEIKAEGQAVQISVTMKIEADAEYREVK